MPIGKYPNFAACVRDQVKQGKSELSARRICGAIEKQIKDKSGYNLDELQMDLAERWTRAFINNLPDAAFAYIASGGKKEGGKTVPRSLRYFPHHKSSVKSGTEHGSVDLPHLRNAFARLDTAKLSAAARGRARAHLNGHAKALKVGDYASVKKEEPKKGACGGTPVGSQGGPRDGTGPGRKVKEVKKKEKVNV